MRTKYLFQATLAIVLITTLVGASTGTVAASGTDDAALEADDTGGSVPAIEEKAIACTADGVCRGDLGLHSSDDTTIGGEEKRLSS